MTNRLGRCLLTTCLMGLLVAGCGGERTGEPVRFYAFGTIIEITLPGLDRDRKTTLEKQLIAKFQHWQQHWHPWENPDGDGLAGVNRSLAEDGRARLDNELQQLIESAATYYDSSDGLFDPAIGGLVKRWGFNGDSLPSSPPPAETLDTWLRDRPRYGDLHIQDSRITTDNTRLQLDFGGFAKGYALEQAAAFLQEQGVDHALINTGGDLKVLGNAAGSADGRAWHVGIRHPRTGGVLARVDLADGEALVTSGDYERYFTVDDERYHHILDPRTARPATGTIAVSVIAADAARADAAATALFVAGPGQWRETAKTMQIDCAMLIDTRGDINMTDCMQQRLDFRIEPAQGIETTP